VNSRVKSSFPRSTAILGAIIYFATSYCFLYFPVLSNNQLIACICVSCSLVVLGMLQAEERGLLRIPKPVAFVGNASFSIYLVHFAVLSAMGKLVKSIGHSRYAL